jgi:hypothetical protein
MLFTGVQWRLSFRQCASSAIVTLAHVLESTLWRNRFQYSDVAWNAGRPQIFLSYHTLHMAVQHCLCLTYGVCSRAPDNFSADILV